MKPLLVYLNMGLGDAIIANGLVRHLAKERNVMFLCKLHNHPSVSWMFKDANVLTVAVDGDSGAESFIAERGDKVEVMRLTGSGNGFDKQFYDMAGVPFEDRWSKFFVQRDRDMEIKFSNPHIFVHDDPERGMAIRPLDIYKRRPILHRFEPMFLTSAAKGYVENIFAFWHAIEFANEIHCIPSAFSVWIDSWQMEMKGTPLFLHASARPGCELPTYRKNWQIV